MPSSVQPNATESAFRANGRFLWALAYRMTGSAADADDVVQESFVRALRRPPEDANAAWRPWLARVAVNLSRDVLRRRRRRGYVGPWLPAPIETGDEASDPAPPPAARYDLLESASFAFLLSLEALPARQRAALLLRDVFDYSSSEAAAVLGLGEGNVRVLHHRARQRMEAYDAAREHLRPTRAGQDRHRGALERFMAAMTTGDMRSLETLFAESARSINDGGGDYTAALKPVVGADKVIRFLGHLLESYRTHITGAEMRMLNGFPALIVEFANLPPSIAPRQVVRLELDVAGRITEVQSVLARRKLSGVR